MDNKTKSIPFSFDWSLVQLLFLCCLPIFILNNETYNLLSDFYFCSHLLVFL
jgi:hypothetical protein